MTKSKIPSVFGFDVDDDVDVEEAKDELEEIPFPPFLMTASEFSINDLISRKTKNRKVKK